MVGGRVRSFERSIHPLLGLLTVVEKVEPGYTILTFEARMLA
jgi:hypothetical protein